MGMTVIVGIVTEAAIFCFCDLAELSARTPLAGRVIQAGCATYRHDHPCRNPGARALKLAPQKLDVAPRDSRWLTVE
ncbi:MAG: hypothetical protein H0V62_00705 [Gammaproteobacteria bacterium]|nr:hypothetical protein [Gammaproteobacteria bacterium]